MWVRVPEFWPFFADLKVPRHITGIDIDPWSVENAVENAERNGQNGIEVLEGSMDRVSGRQFDVVLANINRNALTEMMAAFSGALREGGRLLISGFYQEDLPYLNRKLQTRVWYLWQLSGYRIYGPRHPLKRMYCPPDSGGLPKGEREDTALYFSVQRRPKKIYYIRNKAFHYEYERTLRRIPFSR